MNSTDVSVQDNPQALTKLIINNTDLDRLESMLSEFNLFESVGVIKQEIRHSSSLTTQSGLNLS